MAADIISGVVCGLIAMVAYGLSSFLTPLAIKRYGLVQSILYREVFGSLFLLSSIFLLSPKIPNQLTAETAAITLSISLIGFFPVITLFKSLGVGLEDVAVASIIYHRAVASGRFKPL